MKYVYWLIGLSAAFVLLERLRPRSEQPILRGGIGTDLFYLVFNGHFLGVALAAIAQPILAWADGALEIGVARSLPGWAQFLIALFAVDLLHWSIHNLLHRVPALWEIHKVHHSIVTMDWIGSMRFHWGEGIVYKSLTYPLLAFFGFHGDVLFALAVVNTAVGHFNHANLAVSIGPLKYLLNSPEMHVWHHAHPSCAPPRNFGITLSLWDWLFGTAILPDHPPERLGFEDIDSFPTTVPGQMLHPLPVERAIRRLARTRGGKW
jgi:sterol desaturase/sphingolipid hydroxylase (fatty acid hydroxylase superfamily)